MNRRTLLSSLAAGVSGCAVGRGAAAAEKERYSAIYLTDMHCADCARKIARKLYAVPGVVTVKADLDKNIAFVIHQKQKDPSPKALWEAVEGEGFEVVKVYTPAGFLTEKPQQ